MAPAHQSARHRRRVGSDNRQLVRTAVPALRAAVIIFTSPAECQRAGAVLEVLVWDAERKAVMTATFVLVPGGWGGAWWYREAASELRRRGHQAHPVPLTGVGERAAQLTGAVNLDTHIRDVVAVIEPSS
jgi:hypothetical protein